jgi:hypothetical protein
MQECDTSFKMMQIEHRVDSCAPKHTIKRPPSNTEQGAS